MHMPVRDAACVCVGVYIRTCVFGVLLHVRVSLHVHRMHFGGVHNGHVCVQAWVYTCVFTGRVHLQGCDGQVGLVVWGFGMCVLTGSVMTACACVYMLKILGSI